MPVLYESLRFVLRYALELYFVDIQCVGSEHVPEEGPVIFAANHPNSIMDTVILGTKTNRNISYLARSGLFANPAVAALFDKCGVIPIYRAQDNPSGLSNNSESFRKAYDVLDAGGAIGIFPEGTHSFERRVKEIKTGTARIALGAAQRADYALDVKIVPVGLNFENRDRFLSSVLVKFGPPISVSDYADEHSRDDWGAVRALTEAISERLHNEAVHIETELASDLARDIEAIYGKKLVRELLGDRKKSRRFVDRFFDEVRATPGAKGDLEDRFWVRQRIASAIAWFMEHDPALVERIRADIRRYKDHLAQVELRHDFMDRPPNTLSIRKESVKFTLYAFAFAVPAVWGLVNNVLPYWFTKRVVLRAPDEAMRAFTAFCVAMVAFPVFYGGLAYGAWTLSGSVLLAIATVISLPFAGFFFLRYRRQLARYRQRIMARTVFRTDRNLIWALARERERIVARLHGLRERYVEATGPKVDEYLDGKAP
jgi:1-acyl-sn-glycerol-3-phosphate acyltransferase